nr:hypothetical protein [Tanacetum cinerariifolium]
MDNFILTDDFSIQSIPLTTLKLPSLIGIRSISKGWFKEVRVQPWVAVLVPTRGRFPVPIVLSWGDNIRPEGFRPSILLLMVIIVTVAIVVAVVLVIIDMIIGIVVVVGAPSIIKLVFVITGVFVGPVFLLRLLVLAMVAACASSAAIASSGWAFVFAVFVVDAIIGIVVVGGGAPSIIKLSFVIIEIVPPKKRARGRSSFSTSALPQVFEIEESSRVTRLERHEEQIKEILNHLDELSLDRIEHMEDKI